jgi:protein gp37
MTWKKPRMVFVNSMSDLFQDGVPDEYILEVARIMHAANWHTFQVLTKRSERMSAMLKGPLRFTSADANIWWGVSVEDRTYGLPRIAHLRAAPVAIRFLSIEPLLEELGCLELGGISWIIVGGESGPYARPIEKFWVESILEQANEAKVPFFFKQWGGVNKSKTGRKLNGRTYDEMPGIGHLF